MAPTPAKAVFGNRRYSLGNIEWHPVHNYLMFVVRCRSTWAHQLSLIRRVSIVSTHPRDGIDGVVFPIMKKETLIGNRLLVLYPPLFAFGEERKAWGKLAGLRNSLEKSLIRDFDASLLILLGQSPSTTCKRGIYWH